MSVIKFPGRVMELFIQAAKKKRAGKYDKLKSFFVLLSLELKGYLHGKKKVLAKKNIQGYTIYGYKYRTLQWLYNEVFLKKEYTYSQ